MYPEVSQTINIELQDNAKRKHLRATILDVTEKEIIINYPIDEDTKKLHYLANSEKIVVIFTKKTNTEKVLYEFKTKLVKKINGHIPCIVLEKPKANEINRIQRRDFLRIDALFDVKILASDLDNKGRKNDILLTTRNISGGGIRLSGINHSFKIGTNLDGILYFEKEKTDITEIGFKGEIVNTMQSSQDQDLIEYGVQFLKISRIHQEMIIQFCLKKQIEIHRSILI